MRRFGCTVGQSRIFCAALVVTLGAASSAGSADSYTITDLGVLPGGASSSGLGINSLSQVAGTSDASDANGSGKRGMLVDHGVMTNLGLPPVPMVLFSAAPSLNDMGDIIVNGNNGAYHAGPGWDACSGLGSPNGQKLLQAFGGGPAARRRRALRRRRAARHGGASGG